MFVVVEMTDTVAFVTTPPVSSVIVPMIPVFACALRSPAQNAPPTRTAAEMKTRISVIADPGYSCLLPDVRGSRLAERLAGPGYLNHDMSRGGHNSIGIE